MLFIFYLPISLTLVTNLSGMIICLVYQLVAIATQSNAKHLHGMDSRRALHGGFTLGESTVQQNQLKSVQKYIPAGGSMCIEPPEVVDADSSMHVTNINSHISQLVFFHILY